MIVPDDFLRRFVGWCDEVATKNWIAADVILSLVVVGSCILVRNWSGLGLFVLALLLTVLPTFWSTIRYKILSSCMDAHLFIVAVMLGSFLLSKPSDKLETVASWIGIAAGILYVFVNLILVFVKLYRLEMKE